MKTNMITPVLALAAAGTVVASPMVTVKITSTITVCDSTTSVGAVGTDNPPAMTSGIEGGVTPPIISAPTTTLDVGASSSSVTPGEVGSGMTGTDMSGMPGMTESGTWSTFTPTISSFTSSTLITPGLNGTAALSSSSMVDAVSGGSASSTTGTNGTQPTSGTGGAASSSSSSQAPAPTGDAGALQMQGSVLGLVVFCAIGLVLF